MNLAPMIEKLVWAGVGGFIALIIVLGLTRVRTIHPGIKVWLCRLVFFKLTLGAFVTFTIIVDSNGLNSTLPRNDSFNELAWFLAIMWLLGASVVLAHLKRGIAEANTLRRTASRADLMAIEGVPFSLEVRHANGLPEPCVVGALRPCLIVPTGWQVDQSVITHEFTHIVHRDLLWNSVTAIVFAIFWFVPGLGRLVREAALWQEAWADQVARERSAVAPTVQARHLLSAIEKVSSPSWARVGFAGEATQVARRIRAMYQGRHSKVVAVVAVFIATFAAVPIRLEGAPPARFIGARSGDQSLTQGISLATLAD